MNIHCEWRINYGLEVYRDDRLIGSVLELYVGPTIRMKNYEILTFTEIEHIMDCWENMPKN